MPSDAIATPARMAIHPRRKNDGGRPSIPTDTDLPTAQSAPVATQATPRTFTAAAIPNRNCAAMNATKNATPAMICIMVRVFRDA